jgi:hypothetical protein
MIGAWRWLFEAFQRMIPGEWFKALSRRPAKLSCFALARHFGNALSSHAGYGFRTFPLCQALLAIIAEASAERDAGKIRQRPWRGL